MKSIWIAPFEDLAETLIEIGNDLKETKITDEKTQAKVLQIVENIMKIGHELNQTTLAIKVIR